MGTTLGENQVQGRNLDLMHYNQNRVNFTEERKGGVSYTPHGATTSTALDSGMRMVTTPSS